MINEAHKNRLRRLRVLQQLDRSAPEPMGEKALLHGLRVDLELQPTIDKVRRSLGYLHDRELIELIRLPDRSIPWMAARITEPGRIWLRSPDDFNLDIYSPGDWPEPAKQLSGKISSVEKLPSEIKAWVDQALAERGKTYQQLVDMLQSQGYDISHSSMGRYGKRFRDEQKQLKQSIEMAKAFAEVVGDDGAAMNQTLTALAQQELMAVIREGRYDEGIKLPALVQSVAQLNRSDINARKFKIQQEARRQALQDAAEAVGKAGGGLSETAVDAIRREILGIGS